HRRAKWSLGRAARPKGLALVRLLHAPQHQPADTLRRLLRRVLAQLKPQFRIKLRIGGAQPQPAARDFADTAPFPVYDLKYLADELLGPLVALAAHRAAVLVLDLRASFLQLLDTEIDPVQDVQRLEAGHDDRDAVLPGDWLVLGVAHDRAD